MSNKEEKERIRRYNQKYKPGLIYELNNQMVEVEELDNKGNPSIISYGIHGLTQDEIKKHMEILVGNGVIEKTKIDEINEKNGLTEAKNPLINAIINNDIETVKSFIKSKNININILNYAIKENNIEIVLLLLENGADVNAKNNNGETCLYYATKENNIEIVQLLLENGADINAINNYGKTPLIYSIWSNNKDIVELLIQKGADVNAKNNYGDTPLYYAIKENNKDIVELLIQKGADVNAINNYGDTPLYYAIKKNKIEIVQFFLENGADVNAKNNYGDTPLIYAITNAIEENKIEIVTLLLENGADVNAKNNYGKTPLTIAEEKKNEDIIKLLKDKQTSTNNPIYKDKTSMNSKRYFFTQYWGGNDSQSNSNDEENSNDETKEADLTKIQEEKEKYNKLHQYVNITLNEKELQYFLGKITDFSKIYYYKEYNGSFTPLKIYNKSDYNVFFYSKSNLVEKELLFFKEPNSVIIKEEKIYTKNSPTNNEFVLYEGPIDKTKEYYLFDGKDIYTLLNQEQRSKDYVFQLVAYNKFYSVNDAEMDNNILNIDEQNVLFVKIEGEEEEIEGEEGKKNSKGEEGKKNSKEEKDQPNSKEIFEKWLQENGSIFLDVTQSEEPIVIMPGTSVEKVTQEIIDLLEDFLKEKGDLFLNDDVDNDVLFKTRPVSIVPEKEFSASLQPIPNKNPKTQAIPLQKTILSNKVEAPKVGMDNSPPKVLKDSFNQVKSTITEEVPKMFDAIGNRVKNASTSVSAFQSMKSVMELIKQVGVNMKDELMYAGMAVAPLVAAVELVITIASVILIVLEAWLRDDYKEDVALHRELLNKVVVLVEKLPEVQPIDDLEMGEEQDPNNQQPNERNVRKRLEYFLAIGSNQYPIEEVEEDFASYHIANGSGSLFDFPKMMSKQTISYGPDEEEKKDLIIEYMLYPLRTQEYLMNATETPYTARMNVINPPKRSFVNDIEHLLYQTLAIMNQMSVEREENKKKKEAQEAEKKNQLQNQLQNQSNAQSNTESATSTTEEDKNNSANNTSSVEEIGDYLTEIRQLVTNMRNTNTKIVEQFTLPNGKKEVSRDGWNTLLDLYDADPNRHPFTWYFLSASKYLLKKYLEILQVYKPL